MCYQLYAFTPIMYSRLELNTTLIVNNLIIMIIIIIIIIITDMTWQTSGGPIGLTAKYPMHNVVHPGLLIFICTAYIQSVRNLIF